MHKKVNQAGAWEYFSRSVYQTVDLYMEARQARKSLRNQLKTINGGFRASKQLFRTTVLPFWSKYKIKPNKDWFDLYSFKDGEYDPRYIPEDIYWQKIYPALNETSFRHAYTDKCIYKKLFPYLKQPRTILKNSNGCFFDGSGNIVSFEQAQSLLKSERSFVIKPAVYSGEGIDIFFYDATKNEEINFKELLKSYHKNFIVQEVAKQHEVLASIHPDSLNTLRVISFLFQGDVHISSSILRMGVGGCRLDNVSTGGLACPVLPDGSLEKKAMNLHSEWQTHHPGGTIFADVKIPSYDKVLSAIKRAHQDVPHFRIIGWDFSIDENGEPIFIEYNGAPGMNQVSCGPIFGELTEEVLDTIFLDKAESINELI